MQWSTPDLASSGGDIIASLIHSSYGFNEIFMIPPDDKIERNPLSVFSHI